MTEFDLQVGARTIAQEARGEPLEGQTAVAWTLRNRAIDGRWGKSIASVCLWRAQFSGWYSPRGNPPVQDPNFSYACGLQDDDPVLLGMRTILVSVMASGADPTGGALFYYAASIEEPSWAQSMRSCGKFGNQFFLSDKAGAVPAIS